MNHDDLELYEVAREESAPDAVVEELTAKDFATAQRYMSRVKYHRTKYEPIKGDIKEAAKVEDGKVLLANADGELVELPIVVTKRPSKVTITIA